MYEVFLNDHCIVIADEQEPVSSDFRFKIVNIQDDRLLRETINSFLSGDEKYLLLRGDAGRCWNDFRHFFRLLPAAGGIVRSRFGLLFIFRRGMWDLPKGKIDPHEKPEEAALREVGEETGLHQLEIIGRLPSTWHIYLSGNEKKRKDWILKETHWFMMASSGNEPLVPQTNEDIEMVKWVPEEHLDEVLPNTYASLKNLIKNLRK